MTSRVMPVFVHTTAADTRRGFVERPGCRVYYEVTGSGPAIIFAHGIGSNHMTWWVELRKPDPLESLLYSRSSQA